MKAHARKILILKAETSPSLYLPYDNMRRAVVGEINTTMATKKPIP